MYDIVVLPNPIGNYEGVDMFNTFKCQDSKSEESYNEWKVGLLRSTKL